MTLTSEGKLEIVRKFGRDEKDTGSAEVQIALLTTASTSSPSTCGCTRRITTRGAVCCRWWGGGAACSITWRAPISSPTAS